MPEPQALSHEVLRLVEIIRRLRAPDGCPWDRKQTAESMKKNLLEEANEVIAAVEEGDALHVCEELGDLLMMIVFYAQMAEESGMYDMTRVAAGISDKLTSRHPHIFGDAAKLGTPEEVVDAWKILKTQEKADRKRIANRMREAAGFTSSLRAAKTIQDEAATVGFDFPNARAAIDKITEESRELAAAADSRDQTQMTHELGDLLFSLVNVARMHGIDPDAALRGTNDKFIGRFAKVEDHFATRGGMQGQPIEELDAVWDRVKGEE